nr:hypothetical protein [Tanacetum cinerariifolium]
MNWWLIEDDDEEVEEEGVDDKDDEEMEMDEEDKDDDETAFAPPVVPISDVDDVPIPPVIQFRHNFHLREGSSVGALLAGNSEVNATGSIACNLESVRRMRQGWLSKCLIEERPIHSVPAPRANDPYVIVRDAAMATREEDDDDINAPRDPQPSEPRGSPRDPYQGRVPPVQECSFAGFMKCGPTQFHRNEGAVEFCCFHEIIKGETTSSRPAILNEAVRMAHTLMEQKIQDKAERVDENNKRKRQGGTTAMTPAQNDDVDQGGPALNSNHYGLCHFGQCLPKCNRCGKRGHKTNYCRKRNVATRANMQPIRARYECRDRKLTLNQCPRLQDQREGNATGIAYAVKETEQGQGPNVVTGTFLLNKRYAHVLFDSGSDKSFINSSFSHLIDIEPMRLNTRYEVELADGRIVSTNTVLKGCTLNLINHLFEIDLMPIELSTFDIVIEMDWLVERDVVIVCGKKEVHIPVKNEVLVVKGNECVSRLKEPSEKQLQDVPVIHDFPKVFPDDLPGLPPPRKVKFRIKLFPGAVLVARVPYHLAPLEMKELSDQLKELSDKGFIRPSSSP